MSEKGFNRANMIAAVMYILFVCAAVALFVFREYWLSAVQIFHISTELLCMAVTLVMYTLHLGKKQENEKKANYLAALCVVIYLAMFIDMISRTVDGSIQFAWLNLTANCIVYVIMFLHAALFFEYIFSYIENMSDHLKKLKRGMEFIIGLALIVRIVMVVTGQYFTIDESGRCQIGNIFFVSYIFIILLSVFSCGIASGAGLTVRRMAAFLTYPLSIICMLGIALINKEYVSPLMAINLSMILIYCSTFLDMERNKSNLNESLQTYLSNDITNGLNVSDQPAPGGTLTHATMLFCSIHHFGEVMETMEPEDAVIVLNHFYSSMTDIIEENNGSLLEYPGYGLFCIFGEFSGCEHHAETAVKTAYLMQQQMKAVNQWTSENHYPELTCGIGINTGDAILGNIGSSHHMRHSAISKHVNLASRTATYADDYEIMLTGNTLNECGGSIKASFVNTIIPKGIAEPVDIYKIEEIE